MTRPSGCPYAVTVWYPVTENRRPGLSGNTAANKMEALGRFSGGRNEMGASIGRAAAILILGLVFAFGAMSSMKVVAEDAPTVSAKRRRLLKRWWAAR